MVDRRFWPAVTVVMAMLAAGLGGLGLAQDADDPIPGALRQLRQAVTHSRPEAALQAMQRIEGRLEKLHETAVDQRNKRRNRRTFDAMRERARVLESFRQELHAFRFARATGIAYTTEDVGRVESAVLGRDGTGKENPPRLHIRPSSILRVTPRYVVWTVDGTTRVPREGFALPKTFWDGHELRAQLDKEGVDGLAVAHAGASAISISAAPREREPFQIVITPRNGKPLRIGKAEIADFVRQNRGGRIAAEHVDVNLVGYVWAEDPKTGKTTHGPYADVLFPEGHRTAAELGLNYNLWFTVHVPPGTAAGTYEASVTLNVDGADLRPIPVSLRVWGFELPVGTHVDTQLFNLTLDSLSYYYGVPYWHDRAQALVRDWAERMARHRFSLYATPPVQRPAFETFPKRGDGAFGKHLAFDGNALPLAGLDDHHLRDGFTLCCWVRTRNDRPARVFAHHWGNRPVGSDLTIEDGRLVAGIGLGFPTRAQKKVPQRATVSAPWPKDRNWRHVALRCDARSVELHLDGRLAAKEVIPYRYAPALNAFQLGSSEPGEQFDLDELRWADRALSETEIRAEMQARNPLHATFASFSFEEDLYNFEKRIEPGSSEELDAKWFWQWVEWARRRGLFLNDLKPLRQIAADDDEALREFARTYYTQLRDRGILSKTYVRLPSDEGVYGARRERNIKFARAVGRYMPELKRHQTLGAMHWGQTSKQEKREAIEAFVGHVDVWSMVPLVMTTFHDDVFKNRVAAGDEICLYINRTEAIQHEASLPAARFFLWYLWKYDLNMLNYWGTTLWSQPDKGSKPEKRTWEVDWGFRFWRRNPSPSMTAAVLFWPGKDGLLDSIRAENWREGIEDYEHLILLEEALRQARAAKVKGAALVSAQRLYDELRAMKTYGRNFEGPPTSDSSWFFVQKAKVAQSVEAIRRALSRRAGRPRGH